MQEKIKKAIEAWNNSYSPYSKFAVGACLVLTNGEYILGANIENASYGLTNCAERSALFQAYSRGYRKNDIKELARHASAEANPIYPVPVLFGKKELENLYYELV